MNRYGKKESVKEGKMIDSGAICSFTVEVKSQLSVGTKTRNRKAELLFETDSAGSRSHYMPPDQQQPFHSTCSTDLAVPQCHND